MIRLENLSELQREIIRSLPQDSNKGVTLNEIKASLDDEEYNFSLNEIREGVRELLKYGAVRGKSEDNIKKYSLSRALGSGRRNQASLLNKFNPFRDMYKLIERVIGSVFVLFGVFILYQNSTMSGSVISNIIKNQTNSSIISIGLVVLGGILLFLSFNKNK